MQSSVGKDASHALHSYTDSALALRHTLVSKMKKMTPAQFENVLHPVFQEDEMTLILAGGVLGLLAGLMQWWGNEVIDAWLKRRRETKIIKSDLTDKDKLLIENSS